MSVQLQPLERASRQVEILQEKLQKKKELRQLDLACEVGKALGVYLSKKSVLEKANQKLERKIGELKEKHVKELNGIVSAYQKKNDLVQESLTRIIEMIDLYTQAVKKPCGALQIDSRPFTDFKNAILKVDYLALRKYPEYPEVFANQVALQGANSTPAISCLSPFLIYQASGKAPKTLQFDQKAPQSLPLEPLSSLERSGPSEALSLEIDKAPPKNNIETATEEFIEERETEFQTLVKDVASLELINKKLLQKQEEMIVFHRAFLERFNKERQEEIDPKQTILKIRSLIDAVNWGFKTTSCPKCPYLTNTANYSPFSARILHEKAGVYNTAELTRLHRDVTITVDVLEDRIDPSVIKNE